MAEHPYHYIIICYSTALTFLLGEGDHIFRLGWTRLDGDPASHEIDVSLTVTVLILIMLNSYLILGRNR